MAYSEKQIAEAVSTVHMNSKRQSTRNETINYATGDINFIGDRFFAYSGNITLTPNWVETTLLEFNSGPNILDMHVQFDGGYYNASTSDMKTSVTFNDQIVGDRYFTVEYVSQYSDFGMRFIVPPFTIVKARGATQDTDSGDRMLARAFGKVCLGAERIQGAI